MKESKESGEPTLYEIAEQLRAAHPETDDFVVSVGKHVIDHAKSLDTQYEPESIIESRFTPALEAYEKGMLSCGAIVNMSTEMIRHAGLKVKLIHGESSSSADHAWISVLDPSTEAWKEYDLTEDAGFVPDTNIKHLEADSWEEIQPQIEADHLTYSQRMREKGLRG